MDASSLVAPMTVLVFECNVVYMRIYGEFFWAIYEDDYVFVQIRLNSV